MIGTKILLLVAGYLLGSIPFGLVLARLKGVDPRKVGSGNIGATNTARAAGKGVGAATLVLDAVKASIPMLVARRLLAGDAHAEAWVLAVGFFAFVGHVYPVWLGFKGGKGVATGLGVFLVAAPIAALVGLVAFAVGYKATRVVAVGSLAGAAVCTAGVVLANGVRAPASWVGIALLALIAWRHKENIARLRAGAEHKV